MLWMKLLIMKLRISTVAYIMVSLGLLKESTEKPFAEWESSKEMTHCDSATWQQMILIPKMSDCFLLLLYKEKTAFISARHMWFLWFNKILFWFSWISSPAFSCCFHLSFYCAALYPSFHLHAYSLLGLYPPHFSYFLVLQSISGFRT